jgi:hypothetical protein
LFVWYNDGNSTQWVPASPVSTNATGIDIRSFGAVGDWNGAVGTDNTAAINAAMAAASASPTKTVFIPGQAFGITGTINGIAGVSIIGAGRGQARICTATNNLTMLKLENISTIGIVLKGFSLEGVTGGSGTTGMYVGSTIEQTGHMMMQDVQFLNHRRGTDGGSTYTLFDSRMEKLDFYGCSEWGEFLGGSQVGHSTCTYRVCGEGVRVGSVSTFSVGGGSFENSCTWLNNTMTSHSTPPLFARST